MRNWFAKKTTRFSEFLWNILGSGFFAVQAALILTVISRKYDIETAGMVTFAYAFAVLIYAVSRWGMRNYQASDLDEKFSFRNYLGARVISCLIAILITFVFLAIQFASGNYAIDKLHIILGIAILKVIDAFEDVILGRLQQKDIFIAAAKMMAIHQIAVTAMIMLLAWFAIPIQFLFYFADAFAVLMMLGLIWLTRPLLSDTHEAISRRTVFTMLKECMPLNIGIALSVYVSNIPKYAIDMYMSEEVQAILGYIMLPVFVVTLVSQFLYQPFIRELAYFWESGQLRRLYKKMLTQIAWILGCTVLVLVGCWVIGLQILSWMYHVNLLDYKMIFTIFLGGGALYALAFYLNVLLTITRCQHSIAIGYLLATAVALLSQKTMADRFGVSGIAWLYLVVNAVMFLVFIVTLLWTFRKRSKQTQ